MVKKAGFIKIHRKMLDWEWFDDNNTFKLFMYCLLRANFEDTDYKGIKIKKGSFLTSYKTISQETGLSIQNIRTSIKKLKLTQVLTQVLTQRQHGSYSIITVVNWTEHQGANTGSNTKANSKSTLDKKIKEIKEDNKEKINKKEKFILSCESNLQECLRNWLEYRKDLRSKEQWEFQHKKLLKLKEPQFSVENSIGNGYKGLFEIDNKKINRKSSMKGTGIF